MPRRHSWRQNLKDLTALTETLISCTDPDELYSELAQKITQILGARSCVIALFDGKKRVFETRSQYGVRTKDGKTLYHKVDREQARLWNFRTQGTLLSNTPAADERIDSYFVQNYSIRSVILAPMIVRRQVIGLIAVINKRGKFSEFDSYLASIIANQAGNIVTNARLIQEEKKRVEQIRMLNEMAHRVNSTLVVEEMLDQAIRAVVKALGIKEVAVYIPSEDCSFMQMSACTGATYRLVKEQGYIQSVQVGLIGKCYRTGESVLSNDCAADPDFLPHPLVPAQSEACIPVKRDNTIMAVLDVGSPERNAFTDEDILTLETLADQLAVAFNNALIIDSERKHNVQLLLLSELISEISVIRDPKTIVRTTVDRIKQRFRYYFIAIGWVNEETQLIQDWYYVPRFDAVSHEMRTGIRLDQGLTGRAARTGQTIIVGDVSREPDYLNVLSEVRSEMAIPVKIGDHVVAVLDLESDLRNAFDESDRLSMETLAHALSTAIQNANSYHALEKINIQLSETARMKDEIVQIVAHDFRSPLTVIRGYMDHLLKKEQWKDERQKEIMETVSAQAQRLQRLAEATLKASRLDSGDISFSYEKVDFQSFLNRLIFPWSEKHTFVMEVQKHLPLIRGDAGRLQEVMENLLSNAIKYSPQGGKVTITVRRAHAEDLPGDVNLPEAEVFLVVSVSDEGVGIPDHKKELLFRRFTRLHDSRRIEGIGLGLYIAKKMIETHGGRIWLEDRDHGACFSFALPAFEEIPGEDTILIIDDDIHTLRLIHKTLTQMDYDVVTAAEGKEALEKLIRFRPRLIVVDILMPVMGGDELIRRLREGSSTRDIPIIVFTGQRDFTPAPEYGDIPVISKNAGVEALAAKVADFMQ